MDAPKFQSLSDLGKYHLEKNKVPLSSNLKFPVLIGGFVLPKLDVQPSNLQPTSELASFASAQLKKFNKSDERSKNDQKVENKSEEKSEKIVIDLKLALVSEAEKKKISSIPLKPEVKHEVFIPKFVGCNDAMNLTVQKLKLEDDCERLTLKQLKSRFQKCSLKRFSPVGAILRLKYKQKLSKIRHGYEHRHIIKPFSFDTLSPDDKILVHLNRVKK